VCPPTIERPTSVKTLDAGIGPGEASWLLSHFAADLDLPMHRTDLLSLTTLLSGSVDLILEAERVPLGAGDRLVL
jgi:hypothetical protein